MKTKTNKVPLVGPRGRRELLDRIEELEKKLGEGSASDTLNLSDRPDASGDSYSEFLDNLAYCGINDSMLNDIFAGKVSKLVVENNNIKETYYITARQEMIGECVNVHYGSGLAELQFNQNDDGTYYAGLQ